MLRNIVLFLFAACALYSPKLQAQAVMLDTARDHYMKIDDVRIHYRTWGKGDVVLLLHGAMEYWKEWEHQIPALAREYKVIAVDTRGHGGSSFTDRELSYDLFANDMLELMDKMHLDSVDVVGFGDGGIIGMAMAMKQPDRIHKLVAIGSNLRPDTTAVYKEVLDKVKAWDMEKMAFYLQMKFKDNPNPKLLPELSKRMQKLLLTQPQMTLNDLRRVQCPTLIMAGDHDFIKMAHTEYIYDNLPNGFLSIIPGATHYCNKEKYTVVNATIIDFLRWNVEHVNRY